MRFALDEDHLLLRQTLRDFLQRECTPSHVRSLWETQTGRSPQLWRQLAELGVPGLRVPEAHGGLGLDEVAFVGLFEEVGRVALAEPLVATAAVGVPLLLELDGTEHAERWLKAVAVGEARIAVGHPVSPFVEDAHVADLLLLPHEGTLHALGRDAVEATAQPANDPSRRLFSLRWSPGAGTQLASGETARRLLAAALDRGALACAAQLVGAGDRLLELAVAYAGQREQFGRPIGSFQAVKHQLADVKVALEYARPLVQRAAWSVATGASRRGLHVSMAKAAAARAAQRAARVALQVHGAIGYTWEQDLHLWMRRAWSLAGAWGSESFHRARVAEEILERAVEIGPGTTFAGEA